MVSLLWNIVLDDTSMMRPCPCLRRGQPIDPVILLAETQMAMDVLTKGIYGWPCTA